MKTPVQQIMIVDDDQDDRMIMEEIVRKIDPAIVCQTAANGREALDKLSETPPAQHPDIIFVDLNMPVMDGYTFLRHVMIHQPLPRTAVGVLSTSAMLSDMKTTKGLGARFYLSKGYSEHSLYDKLCKVITSDLRNSEFIIAM